MITDFEAQDLRISNFSQRTVAILGGKGSGKSETLKVIASEIPRDLWAILFDPIGQHGDIPGYDRVTITKTTPYQKLDLNRISIEHPRLVISFKDMVTPEIAAFFDYMLPKFNRQHGIIMLDEASDVLPESGAAGTLSHEMERAVRNWRNRDIGFVLVCQRAAFLRKSVLALADFVILYRMTWENDLDVARELIGNKVDKKTADMYTKQLATKKFMSGYVIDFRNPEKQNMTAAAIALPVIPP